MESGDCWRLCPSMPHCQHLRLDTTMHTFISLEGEKNDHTYPWCWVTQPTEGRDGGHVGICSSEMKIHVSWEHWQASDVLVCCVTRNGSLPGDWADLSHDYASFAGINSQLLRTVSRENSQNRAVSHWLQVDSAKHEEDNARHASKPGSLSNCIMIRCDNIFFL